MVCVCVHVVVPSILDATSNPFGALGCIRRSGVTREKARHSIALSFLYAVEANHALCRGGDHVSIRRPRHMLVMTTTNAKEDVAGDSHGTCGELDGDKAMHAMKSPATHLFSVRGHGEHVAWSLDGDKPQFPHLYEAWYSYIW